jgi:hypothetical protein
MARAAFAWIAEFNFLPALKEDGNVCTELVGVLLLLQSRMHLGHCEHQLTRSGSCG